MTAGGGGQNGLGLKAREKVLVQLYLHRSEPDETVFPFEVTQKGLSEHLGLRRSHVAVALQDLSKDGLVEAVKGHVEGGDRRQFAYCVTSKGLDAAESIRERILEAEVSFEDASGTATVKVSAILDGKKASLASVICQLERGGPVRDEIALVTTPEKKLISVFCPTCKKQIEVDNVFIDEEVGFDCPGCGRPYRIVPASRREEFSPPPAAAPAAGGDPTTAIVIIAVLITMLFAFYVMRSCFAIVVIVGASLALVVWMLVRKQRKKAKKPLSPTRAVANTLILSPVLLLLWHLTVARMDVQWTLTVLVPVCGGVLLATFALRRYAPHLEGDFLLSSGLLLILIAATTTFTVQFGPVDVGMALAVGIIGGTLVVLTTFHHMDKDVRILDCSMATGVYLVLLAAAVLIWNAREAIDYVATGGVVLLGAVLVGLRYIRESTGAKDLSSHLVASAVFSAAAALAIFGVTLVIGGAVAAGAAELAAAVMLAALGGMKAFDENWPYRVPLVLLFVAVAILVQVAGIVT